MSVLRIIGAGGVSLSVTDIGPRNAPPILLIHGWSQAGLSWSRQHPLAARFRLVIPDLRGHGASDKPGDPAAYTDSAAWAGDIRAIIDALTLDRPVLVGWSMGGWVVGDYLRAHGDGDLAGYALVGSMVATGPHLPDAAKGARERDPAVFAAGMLEDDLAENLSATLAFVRACFHQQPDADDLATMVGFNMLCPPHARRMRRRAEDYRPDHARTACPVLVIRGAHERISLPSMHDQTMAALPRARALTYAHSGHAPFWEEAARFNSDLAAFVTEARA